MCNVLNKTLANSKRELGRSTGKSAVKIKPRVKYNTIVDTKAKSKSMIGNYPMKPFLMNIKKDIMRNAWKKKKSKEIKGKSGRSNLVTRVNVPATTTSIKSIKLFKPDEYYTSLTPADLRLPTSKHKSKGSPGFKYSKPREAGIRSELSDRKEAPNYLKMYSQSVNKSSIPNQSIE